MCKTNNNNNQDKTRMVVYFPKKEDQKRLNEDKSFRKISQDAFKTLQRKSFDKTGSTTKQAQ